MRLLRLAAAAAAVSALVAMPAVAGSCCENVTIIYGAVPVPYPAPPPGHLLDPSDQRAPVYIVDQGPVIEGPGIYTYHEIEVPAQPTYSEGGYAFPYVRHSYGRQPYRPYGVAPYDAYLYRPAPNARIIHVQ
jgi:hypothetical protein